MGGIGPAQECPESLDDRQLVERAKHGEREAFASLVRRHQDRAFNLAYQMVRNREDALDVAQEAFTRAYTSLPTFKGDATFSTWLHRIVVNLAIDSLRRRRRGGEATYDDARGLPEEPEADLPAGEDPVTVLEAKQTRALLARGIEQLPPAQRAVVILREIEGMSYEEIAQAVGCNPGTVMSRLFYARRKLQQILKAHLADLR
jgi:RNA polymerase sigma-70 factor (ECF subfamily)